MEGAQGERIHFAQDEQEYESFTNNEAAYGTELAGFLPEQAQDDGREELRNTGIPREEQVNQEVRMENGEIQSDRRQNQDQVAGNILHMFRRNVFVIMAEAFDVNITGNQQGRRKEQVRSRNHTGQGTGTAEDP